jgi:hypothetical protein
MPYDRLDNCISSYGSEQDLENLSRTTGKSHSFLHKLLSNFKNKPQTAIFKQVKMQKRRWQTQKLSIESRQSRAETGEYWRKQFSPQMTSMIWEEEGEKNMT